MKAKWRQRRRTSPEQSRVGALAKFEKLKIKVKVCSHVGGGGERFAITSV